MYPQAHTSLLLTRPTTTYLRKDRWEDIIKMDLGVLCRTACAQLIGLCSSGNRNVTES